MYAVYDQDSQSQEIPRPDITVMADWASNTKLLTYLLTKKSWKGITSEYCLNSLH